MLMMVLTVTGLIVGVVVSERQTSDRIARDAQAWLLERQAGGAGGARQSGQRHGLGAPGVQAAISIP
jgi:hypothetical protein